MSLSYQDILVWRIDRPAVGDCGKVWTVPKRGGTKIAFKFIIQAAQTQEPNALTCYPVDSGEMVLVNLGGIGIGAG